MSAEHLKPQHESERTHENDHELQEIRKKNIEQKIEAGEKAKTDDLEKIRGSIEDSAKSVDKISVEKDDDQRGLEAPRLDRTVKKRTYKKELTRVRKKLNTPQKAFSSVIHNPAVDAISEVGSKTVARPSGLLGGGVIASLGTLALYIASRYYGFEYNFFVFILLLVLGFIVGVCVELILYPMLARNK